MRGQAAVELVVILAVSLLVLFVIISISSQYLAELGTSKVMAEARNSAEDLAAAARQVYYQGEGSRQQVYVRIPEGVNSSKTGISERTIVINVLGTDVLARTDFEIRGSIPKAPGGYSVWVTAKRGYVLIGTLSLSAEPSLLSIHFFSKNSSQSSQRYVTFRNDGGSDIDVELKLNFTPGEVNASLSNPSDSSFSLPPSGYKEVGLDFNVAENAFGSYSGTLYANASNGDELSIGMSVDVTSQICNVTSTSCGAKCTPYYAVIETFNDSTYSTYKEIFDPSEYAIISGSGWEPSSRVTLDIKKPDGSSVSGYPKVIDVDPQGSFSDEWDTARSAVGLYTIHANDSTKGRDWTFSITTCT